MKRVVAFAGMKLAQYFLSRDQRERGIKVLRKVANFAPRYHYALFHLGWREAEVGHYDEAVAYLKRAVEQSPQNSVYHSFLGLVLCDMGNYAEASKAITVALKLDPNNQLTYNCLAICHLGEGEFTEFADLLEEKGIFESADIQTRILLGLECYRRKHGSNTSEVLS